MYMYVCMFQTYCAVWHICFKCYCIYIYDCMFQTCCAVWHICFKSYCFALRGSILRVRLGLRIAPRRGLGGSREWEGLEKFFDQLHDREIGFRPLLRGGAAGNAKPVPSRSQTIFGYIFSCQSSSSWPPLPLPPRPLPLPRARPRPLPRPLPGGPGGGGA